MTKDQRDKHPFHMYEGILAQPDAFAAVVQGNAEPVDRFSSPSTAWQQLYFVGIGTSYHAAQVGEHLVRRYCSGLHVRAWHSFDFALYGPALSQNDCVVAISHRGTKRFTVEAIKRARSAGCRVALITGEGQPAVAAETDAVFQTVGQESSSAHTVSFVGATALLGLLAARISSVRTGKEPVGREVLQESIPAALRAGLALEDEAKKWAREFANRRRIWLVGGGPTAITAQEIALKIKETSYLQAEGMSVESMLHGPLQCAEPEDVFVLIAPSGKSQARVMELGQMVREIGAACLIITDGTAEAPSAGVRYCEVPKVDEPWTVLSCLLPLQLFSYFLALERGTNPDGFRLHDPRFASAHKLVQY